MVCLVNSYLSPLRLLARAIAVPANTHTHTNEVDTRGCLMWIWRGEDMGIARWLCMYVVSYSCTSVNYHMYVCMVYRCMCMILCIASSLFKNLAKMITP